MEIKELESILTIGETVAVEFKRCGNGIENDTYETVCSFLNRFGGDLFMGILDDGTVVGIPEKAAFLQEIIAEKSVATLKNEHLPTIISKCINCCVILLLPNLLYETFNTLHGQCTKTKRKKKKTKNL